MACPLQQNRLLTRMHGDNGIDLAKFRQPLYHPAAVA